MDAQHKKKKHETQAHSNPQVIYHWRSPMRVYKKRGKNVVRFFLAVAILLSTIIFFFGDTILLIPIWAALFLFYTLTITPPPDIEHKITKFGIESADLAARWEDLSHFYFIKRFNYDILVIVSHPPANYHFYLVIPHDEVKGELMTLLGEHLIYVEKPSRTIVDKAIDAMLKLVPEDE